MATTLTTHPLAAAAQSDSGPALVAARELFREATADVDAGRHEIALGKFRRVAAVRETAAVRFNIARCEEQIGKLGSALADYEAAAREGSADAKSAEVAKMAQERATAIRPRVPRLTLTPPSSPPQDLVVKLDGQVQSSGALGVPLPVDPGLHRIEATGGDASFTKDVRLADAESSAVAIVFAPAAVAPHPVRPEEHAAPSPKPEEAPKPGAPAPNRVPAYITLGIGGALGATSVVFLLLHNQSASDLQTEKKLDCTLVGGRCPESARGKLDPLQSAAQRNEGLAIGFAAAGAVAVGIGVYLLVKPAAPAATAAARLVPWPGGASLVGEF